jgi:hypothetical protein
METNIIKAESGEIINSDWYKLLLEDCSAIIVEAGFNARWSLVEGYHELGKRILEDVAKFEQGGVYGKQVVKMISKAIQKSERTIYYAIQFVETYPDINSLPEGKVITWSKLCKVYLSNKVGNCPHNEYDEVIIRVCKCCGKKSDIKRPNYIEARMV